MLRWMPRTRRKWTFQMLRLRRRRWTPWRCMYFICLTACIATIFVFCAFIPDSFTELNPDKNPKPSLGVKSIAFGTPYFNRKWPASVFDVEHCPGKKKCVVIDDVTSADAVVFHQSVVIPWIWFMRFRSGKNREDQVWVYYGSEPETRVGRLTSPLLDGYFDMTATYRSDSDIVVAYGQAVKLSSPPQRSKKRNYASGRTKMAYIMTSHCETYSRRLDYIKSLKKHIAVDVIGSCGIDSCPRFKCDEYKLGYKFYLSFENSLCKDYITEKFWRALRIDRIPVVMGASKSDYEKVAPPGSFIHVDDFAGPKELADYLIKLDRNDNLYNKYFEWKDKYVIADRFYSFCGLCETLHNDTKMKTKRIYEKFSDFWDMNKHCKDMGRQVAKNAFDRIKLFLYYIFEFML